MIGGGLSGTLLTVNLLKSECPDAVRIRLIDRNGPESLGPAYSTDEEYLLNVPAGIMGAFPDDPEHFLKWARAKGVPAEKGDFLPRKLYRTYIQETLQEALDARPDNRSFERIQAEATGIEMVEGKARVSIRAHGNTLTDRVVLALGNAPPTKPHINDPSFFQDRRFFNNPWDGGLLERIQRDDRILFIGTGQTMVDLTIGLLERHHEGTITAVSRRGLLPLAHRTVEPYPSFYDELRGHSEILPVFRIVRKHFRLAEKQGLDPRAVIDSLRPDTIDIWTELAVDEKARFIRHVFRYWEIIRSRIPPSSDRTIRELQSAGRLRIVAGTLTDLVSDKERVHAKFLERRSRRSRTIAVDKVVNCVGPNLDYRRRDEPLVKDLLRSGLIQCDPLHLGINAMKNGAVIQSDGTPSAVLFTMGLPLRGILWETIAAPEIRMQAADLARRFLLREQWFPRFF